MAHDVDEPPNNPFAAPETDLGQIPDRPKETFTFGKYEDRWNGWAIDLIISFFLRILATVGITLLLGIFVLPLINSNVLPYEDHSTVILLMNIQWGTFLLSPWLYFALLESSPWQATLGKRLIKTKVTDLGGNRISFGRASVRYFSKYLSFYLLLIGYLIQPFRPKKQALHDILAGTLVIKDEPG